MSRQAWIKGIVIWGVALVILTKRNDDCELIGGKYVINKEEYSTLFVLISILPLLIWAGFREGYGYVDTNAYITMYNSIPMKLDEFSNYISGINTEDKGFSFYLYIIKAVFGSSYRPFIFITALVHCCSVSRFFKRFSWDYPLTLCVFILSTNYFTWMFNGLRQFMAVCIALYAMPFLVEKKYIEYGLIILLASTFHASAIILIPIGIAVTGKPWNIKTLLVTGIAIIAVIATSRFTTLLNSVVANTQYSGVVESWMIINDDGVNPIRVAVYLVPTLLAFWGRHELAFLNNRVVDIAINMSIITSALWIIAMVTSGIYMGRLPIYTLLFNYVLLPIELTVLFEGRTRSIMTVLMIALYLVLYNYQFHLL